jgi:Restriction endonuclease/ATP cone domain
MIIKKASGEEVEFSIDKLRTSLSRSGASKQVIESILQEVKSHLFPGISTKRIYKLAFSLLKKEAKPSAARYQLKNAIMELGPSGFPFEKFIAALLKYHGYKTEVGVIVEGHCVSHELDVVAEKDNHYIMIECKYHNLPGNSSDVKIPLYIHSRFKDVELTWKKLPGHETKNHQGWVVTNTKFTDDAIQYGNCIGLHLIGWNYPIKSNIKTWIDDSGLYPLTCLTTLSRGEKHSLLESKIVLCKEIVTNPDVLNILSLTAVRRDHIIKESTQLCKTC